MATVANAINVIAIELCMSKGRVKHLARRLKESGALPSACGRHVPEIEPCHAVALVIAVCTDTGAAQATAATEAYGALRYGGLPQNGQEPKHLPMSLQKEPRRAFEYLTSLFETFAYAPIDRQRSFSGCQIEFTRNWHEIAVTYDGIRERVFTDPSNLGTHWQNPNIRQCTTITGAAFGNIARKLFGEK